MNYSFDARKVTQVAAKFIQKEDGIINIMKLVKLIYLLDRVSLDLRGIPVLGGSYFSMKNGPVTGEVLDLINSGDLDGYECDWDTCISSRANHNVELSSDPGDESLSESEKNMINEVYAQHGAKDRYALRDWCHKHLPEWHGNRMGRKEISVEKIWESLGKDAEEIHLFLQDEREIAALNVMLAQMMSSASITIGFTFQPAAANSHVWVVISSPDPDKGRVLCVNWTTLRASSVDDACVLDPGDHDLIRQPSTVVYSKSKMWDPNKIEFSVQQSALLPRNRVSDEVLKKIHAGGKNSPELSQERKDLIP